MPNVHSSLPDVHRPAIPSFSRAVKTTHEHTSNAFLVIILPFGALVVGFVAVGVIAIGARLPFSVVLISSGSLALIFLFGTTFWVIFGKLIEGKEEIFGPDIQPLAEMPPPVRTYFGLPDGPHTTKYGDYPMSPELMIEWCTAAVTGQSLSHEAWAKRFATPGQGDGREKYIEFRRWLCDQGFAKEVGGNVGLRILWNNKRALTFIAGFAQCTPEDGTPLLEAESRGVKNTGARRQSHTRIQAQEWEDDEDAQEE